MRQDYYRCFGMTPETEVCANCTHFYQHYREDGEPIYAGHCAYPRMKPRDPFNSCAHFENKNAPSGAANT